MRELVLAFLALIAGALPARSANPEFKVELFSNHIVKTFTLEGNEQDVNICGAKTDGPCSVLPPATKASCSAYQLIHCRFDSKDRSFTLLQVDSAAPFHVSAAFANTREPPQSSLQQNARVTQTSNGLQVITQVDLESYVSGVVNGEASVLQSPAARQAMAILARTWALRWQGRHRSQGFDFCSLTHCQVFRMAPNIDPAARVTRGQTLQYHGALADPYFTASCGGMTEAAGNVWPDRAQPYLISLRDPYCLTSSHASWTRTLTAESIQQVLREAMHVPLVLPLAELSVEKRDSSGRALVLRAVAGGTWNIDANEFRYTLDRRLGWGQIKSNLYTIERHGDSWIFSGHGLGHGVGLCQAGAEQMARSGSSTGKILSTYFPGAEISLQSSADPDPMAASEHFQLFYPASQEPWVKQTLDTLEQWRRELGAHAEIPPPRVRVTTWSKTEDFIRATGQPGWMAATSDGLSIALQPLDLLARKGILNQTLRHELTHLVVHKLSAKGVPRWFEEGWVLYLTGERIETQPTALMTSQDLEVGVTKPRSELEMKTAYAQALERVRRLSRRRGDAALWQILEHPTADDLHSLNEAQ